MGNTLDRYFTFKCFKGLNKRNFHTNQEYIDRLNYEISIIHQMGYAGYFLIVQDFINWAKNNDIYVGPGRGSGAGSLACYCLGITNLDPLKLGLIFERFLNPSRLSMPDIDVDFEKRYRERVIDYITNKYGADRVAHIGTFNLQRAKAAVRNVTRTLGHPYSVGDELSRLLLEPIHGKPQKLETSIEKVKKLKEYFSNNGIEAEILKWAIKLEDIISSSGVHASGIVISNESLYDTVPLFLGRSGELTTQWEMKNIEQYGLIKFDFLGLDALNKIHRCVDLVKERHNQDINIDEIDLQDPYVFKNLREGNATGVFQLEASSGMRDLLVQIRPTRLEDLIALVAIYRPGPLGSTYKETYLKIRAGLAEPEYLLPELKPILEPTSGWIIYQEQVLEIVKQLSGFSMAEADLLRRAIGKKETETLKQQEKGFKDGWVANGYPLDKADTIWEDIVAFSEYAFNKSHAAAYAYITYQTAWLKTHYPREFMCAVMISESGNRDEMIKCLAECKRMGIKVLPPDINESKNLFYVDKDNNIRFGLSPIKNLGESPVSIIMEERENGLFTSFEGFCNRVDLAIINKLKIESLVKAGCFDSLGINRASLIEAIAKVWNYRRNQKSYERKIETFHRKLEAYNQRLKDVEDKLKSENGKLLRSFKKPDFPEQPIFPEIISISELSKQELHQAEYQLLGFYVTSHPLDGFNPEVYSSNYSSIENMKEYNGKVSVNLGAVISNIKEITTKSKKSMAFLVLEDMTGSIEAVCFPRFYNKYKDLLTEGIPLTFKGTVEVTKTENEKIAKFIIEKVRRLEVQSTNSISRYNIECPLQHAIGFIELLKKYKGNLNEICIYFVSSDGTKFNSITSFDINENIEDFMEEIKNIGSWDVP
jgi:DNA polymerase-3 subunit alpha